MSSLRIVIILAFFSAAFCLFDSNPNQDENAEVRELILNSLSEQHHLSDYQHESPLLTDKLLPSSSTQIDYNIRKKRFSKFKPGIYQACNTPYKHKKLHLTSSEFQISNSIDLNFTDLIQIMRI